MKHITMTGILCLTATLSSYSMDEKESLAATNKASYLVNERESLLAKINTDSEELNLENTSHYYQQNIIEEIQKKIDREEQEQQAKRKYAKKRRQDEATLRRFIITHNAKRRANGATKIIIRDIDLIAITNDKDYLNGGKYHGQIIIPLFKTAKKERVNPTSVHTAFQHLESLAAKNQFRENCWETFQCLTCPAWGLCCILASFL